MMRLEDKTPLLRPLQTPLDNIVSFYRYCWLNEKPWLLVVKVLMLVVALLALLGDITDFIDGSIVTRLVIGAGLLLPAIITFIEFARNYESRFTSVEAVEGAFDDVQPHAAGWQRIDLQVQNGVEPVFRCDAMDDMLWNGVPIPLERDTDYEKNLRRRIRNEAVWRDIYYPFLRHNHRAAMYQGKQFYNEKKYGLSQEIDPAAPRARVHKTCYFDTYLTNIIPGQRLTYNNGHREPVDAAVPELLPYRVTGKGRQLYALGEQYTANELGVTTLLIMPNDYIRLWTQNRLAQCSNGLLVASGSGSADWADCAGCIGDADGLRRAVIRGMERELWEESNGLRANERKRFANSVETRITGYFRWLKKGGKSEFVGVSRLTDMGLVGNLSPEASEVFGGTDLPAGTVAELIAAVDAELQLQGDMLCSRRCSVSCSMALYGLRRACEGYCRACPHYQDGGCADEDCGARPYEVLFAGSQG